MLKIFSIFSYSKPPIRLAQPMFSSGFVRQMDSEKLLNLADQYTNVGKIREAEDIYKKLIQEYPEYEKPYQKLWNSWQTYRSLKVTKKELDNFMTMYEKNIEPKNTNGPTL